MKARKSAVDDSGRPVRAVLDSNVLISAAITQGSPHHLVQEGPIGIIQLPADYVSTDVELGYAQTSHATRAAPSTPPPSSSTAAVSTPG